MSILITYTNDNSGMKSKWRDDRVNAVNGQYSQVKQRFEANIKAQFKDETQTGGLSVQDKFTALGTDASQFMAISHAVGVMLVAIDPTYVPPTPASLGYTATINNDGTVTASAI